MPALNFQPHFAELVESGKKCQTIRPPRKRPIKVGDTLYLYTGMRTKACRKLGEVEVESVAQIQIRNERDVWVNSKQLDVDQRLSLAAKDGFDWFSEMADWFDRRYGLPFNGALIRWNQTPSSSSRDGARGH